MKLRPGVQQLAEMMEKRLREFDETKGESGWDDITAYWLHQQAAEKAGEIPGYIATENAEEVVALSVDVCNYMMMIVNNTIHEGLY